MNLSIEEQELHINSSRDSEFATAYCSDRTWITKFDKLVAKAPTLFEVVAENEVSKTYRFPKRLISIRSTIREMSEEQKAIASERFKKMHSEKKQGV